MTSPRLIPELRLQHLARKVHVLGPRPLFELLNEIVNGADPIDRIETYAALDADIVRALGGSDFPPTQIVAGNVVRGGHHV